ncbi:hypothetical protein ACFRAU_11440 [Arthrobacter sp. NPDC056691]|uniref:hypothetical protein n=1 Tax=Arthrobacter sp. NPDC056691 TaxID=3345913 RepID=UPI00366F04AB
MVGRNSTGEAGRGFPRWAWIVIGLVIVLTLVFGVGAWYQARPRPAGSAPTPAASPGTATAPNGCLAGASNDAEGLLQAQKYAGHNEDGAAAFAAAVLRWIAQYPRPSVEDGETVASSILADGAIGTIATLPANLAAAKSLPGVNSGAVNFAEGRYVVEESTPDTVRVTVGGAEIRNGKATDQKIASTLTVVWEDGAWKVRNDGTERTLEDLFASGAAFSGGC